MASNAIERSMFLHNYKLKFTIELKNKEPVLEVILDFELVLDFVCCVNNYVYNSKILYLHDTWRNSMGIPRTLVALAPIAV